MKQVKNVLLCIMALLSVSVSAQMSGNQIYGSNNNSYRENGTARPQRRSITTTGLDFTVSTLVLINVQPDVLLVTLGLNEEAKTVQQCNDAINKRIAGFNSKVRSIGIKEKDVYIDFISQTKIYDYDVSEKEASQSETGYEIKKNIIVRLSDIKSLDELTKIAANFNIYDIVKAEYINDDAEAIYAKLFDEAIKVADGKKQKYVKTFKVNLSDDPGGIEDSYYSVQPKTQYQEYKAFETSELVVAYNNNNRYIRKEDRKNKTFYYQGIDTSAFDKVINPTTPEVCLQYVVEMKVTYHIKR